jgi:hypothetical protein
LPSAAGVSTPSPSVSTVPAPTAARRRLTPAAPKSRSIKGRYIDQKATRSLKKRPDFERERELATTASPTMAPTHLPTTSTVTTRYNLTDLVEKVTVSVRHNYLFVILCLQLVALLTCVSIYSWFLSIQWKYYDNMDPLLCNGNNCWIRVGGSSDDDAYGATLFPIIQARPVLKCI